MKLLDILLEVASDVDKSSDKSVHGKLFSTRLKSIAKALGVSTSNLLRIMEFESGMDPAATNKMGSGARGLIQFMPATAMEIWGISADQIATLSAYDQLLYVYGYYQKNNLPKGADLGDMYLTTIYPAAIKLNLPDTFVVGKEGSPETKYKVNLGKFYKQNPTFDTTGKKEITVGDIRKYITSK